MEPTTRTAPETVSRPAYEKGFETLETELDLDALSVEGMFPEWLTGTLLRNGPAKFEVGEQPFGHWFDGLAMLHKFSFAGGSVSYANRFLRSHAFEAARRDGKIAYSEFATDPCRSIFRRAATLFRPTITDNCNVNLTRLGDEYVAMTETPMPVAFDPETLETLGVSFRPPGIHATAHPHHDRGELIAYVTHFGPRSEYRLFAQRDRSTQRRIASRRVAEPSYMHSFALTERFAVLVAFPLVVNPLDLALSRRPFIANYRWKPERGTEVLVFNRADGSLRGAYEAEPCFSFHHVNAFERAGELVLDMAAYEDATVIDSLYLGRLRSAQGAAVPAARLWRYRIDLDRGRLDEEALAGAPLELPRIDYHEHNGRPYRYVYGTGAANGEEAEEAEFLDRLVKIDVSTGAVEEWHEAGAYPGEPVFVPSPRPDRAEDEGVLLSVVLDARGTSYLIVLDARSLNELGRARVPHHIPFGFHGQYFS